MNLAEECASPADGLALPRVDRLLHGVEGGVVHKDIVHAIDVAVEVAHL